eukprot:745628-Hanusia_phi.AAC.1
MEAEGKLTGMRNRCALQFLSRGYGRDRGYVRYSESHLRRGRNEASGGGLRVKKLIPTESAAFNQLLEEMLKSRTIPDVTNRTFWQQFKDVGNYTLNHGICMESLNQRPRDYDRNLKQAISHCEALNWVKLVPSNFSRMSRKLHENYANYKLHGEKLKIDGELIVSDSAKAKICMFVEDEKTEIIGQWRLRNVIEGSLIGLSLRLNNKVFEDRWEELVTEPVIYVEDGAWTMTCCDLRAVRISTLSALVSPSLASPYLSPSSPSLLTSPPSPLVCFPRNDFAAAGQCSSAHRTRLLSCQNAIMLGRWHRAPGREGEEWNRWSAVGSD